MFQARQNAFKVSKQLSHSLRIQRQLSTFKVVEHIIPCSHTRQYPEEEEFGRQNELKLAVKQYVPSERSNYSNALDEVTIIGAHANGFPKEVYEPMWDELHEQMRSRGKQIRSIWIADMATQGYSGVMNEHTLGNDPSWWDHVRDLLFLINQKQGDMPQPLIGVGHSVGASHLAALSLLHPRLFQALVLIEPVIQLENPSMTFASPSTYRRDLWPSRDDAAAAFRKSKFYQKWDQRVLDKWIQHGLRELPTELYPDVEKNEEGMIPVTLTTTKSQEVFQYLRPLYKGDPHTNKELYADFDPKVLKDNEHFYRPEPREIFKRLPELYPATQFIFGSQSAVSTPDLRRQKLEIAGTGIGGNGGVAANKVSEVVLEDGHLIPMAKPNDCAVRTADFIDAELEQYLARRRKLEKFWKSRSRLERVGIDDEWRRNIGPPPERPSKTATATATVPSDQSNGVKSS